MCGIGIGQAEVAVSGGLRGIYIAEYDFMRFDRWGALIYQFFSLSDHGNGTWRDRPCQEGVYVRVLNAHGLDGTVLERTVE